MVSVLIPEHHGLINSRGIHAEVRVTTDSSASNSYGVALQCREPVFEHSPPSLVDAAFHISDFGLRINIALDFVFVLDTKPSITSICRDLVFHNRPVGRSS